MYQNMMVSVTDGRAARRKGRKVSGGGTTYSGISVSQLLAQRERGMAAGTPPQGKDPVTVRPPQVCGNPYKFQVTFTLPQIISVHTKI